MNPAHRHALRDPALVARVVSRRPLLYAEGADPAQDRPAHVRAASGAVATPDGLWVIQDDALFLGRVLGEAVAAVPLPSEDGVRLFGDDRGNKKRKLDLEAACRWSSGAGGALVAWGSGSTRARERAMVLPLRPDGSSGSPRLVGATPLYDLLRRQLGEAELNLEGAWRTAEGHLGLLQRGNGRGAVDAVFEVEGAFVDALVEGRAVEPRLVAAARWELGALDGVRLTFTDAAALEGGRFLFSAAAEASPDAVADGPVAGSVVGWADARGGRWAPLVDAEGRPFPCKLEGLAPAGEREVAGVVDADDVLRPSELLRIRLEGPWPSLPAASPGPTG